MTKRDFQLKSDGLGIALFAFGVFFAVLIFQAMRSEAGPDPTLLQLAAGVWLASVGALPSLLFNTVLAVVGARLFLGTTPFAVQRHLVAAAFTSAALAILCGAFSETAGGVFGARLGGTIASAAGTVVGAAVGGLALAAAVWFLWVRHDELPLEESQVVRNPELDDSPVLRDDGVSPAEAEALLPRPVATPLAEIARREQLIPPSPYPEDVRRRGEIPAGARPLAASAAAPSVYRWTAPAARNNEQPALAPAAQRAPTLVTADPVSRPVAARVAAAEAQAEAVVLPRASWEDEVEDAEARTVAVSSSTEPGDDIEVDAYGTPRTLVEALRRGQHAAEPAVDAEDFVEELSPARPLARASTLAPEIDDPRLADAHSDGVGANHVLEAETAALETRDLAEFEPVDEDQVDEVADEDEEGDEEGHGADEDFDEEDFDEDELDELGDDADVEFEEPARVPLTAAWEQDSDTAVEDELEADGQPATAALATEPLAHATALEADETLVSTAELEQAEVLAETEFERRTHGVEVEAKHALARSRGQELLDFDASRAALPAVPVSSVFVPGEESVGQPAEREVVLTPPAVAAERAIKAPAGKPEGERTALLAEIGCLFIDRGRVAVSMLQRDYSMDFDEACTVLDDLQQMGLIGPYLGGQRRDILLTREQWLEKVGVS